MIVPLVIFGYVVLGVGLVLLVIGQASSRGLVHLWDVVKIEVPVALLVSLLGALMLVGGYFGPAIFKSGDGPTPTTSVSPQVTTTPNPPPRAVGSFSKPRVGSTIHTAQNVAVSGNVSGLPSGSSMWIVYTATHGGPNYYLISDGPVLDRDGTWDFTDEGVGDSTDVGGTITYHAIQADTACSQALSDAAAKGGDPPTASPPTTCVDIASVGVRVVS